MTAIHEAFHRHLVKDASWVLWTFVTAVAGLFLWVGWQPKYLLEVSGDLQRSYAYHYLFGQIEYGAQFANSGGPWEILYYAQYYPGTFWLVLAGQVAVALGLVWVLARIMRDHVRHAVLRLYLLIGALGLFTMSLDARFFFLILSAILFMPDYRARRFHWDHLFLIVLLALFSLVKGTFLMGAGVVIGTTAILEIVQARRWPLSLAVFAAALIVFNAAAGQNPLGLFAQFREVISFSAGYIERYSEIGPYRDVIGFFAVAAPIGLVILVTEVRRLGWWGIITVLAYAAVFFLLFKSGFVRQDGKHVLRTFATLLPFGPAYVFYHGETLKPLLGLIGRELLGPGRLLASSAGRIAGYGLAVLALTAFFALKDPVGKLDLLMAQASGIWDVVLTGQGTFRDRHAAGVEDIRTAFPLPALEGPVSAFAVRQKTVIAHGLDYLPLPSSDPPQGMSPRSDGMNAKFLSGPGAPRHVLYAQPVYANTAAGLALLTNYTPVDMTRQYLQLRKTAERLLRLEPLAVVSAAWGERVEIPEAGGDSIRAAIHYERTLLNRVLGFLYQPAPVYLVYFEGADVVRRERLTQAIAGTGLLISPDLRSNAVFGALGLAAGREYLRHHRVTAIRLEIGDTGNWLAPLGSWAPFVSAKIDIAFERVLIDSPPPGIVETVAPRMQAFLRLLQFRPATRGRAAKIVDLADGRPALAITPQTPMRLTIGPDIENVAVEFSLPGGGGEMVTFAAWLESGSQLQPLAAHKLTPAENAGVSAAFTIEFATASDAEERAIVIAVQGPADGPAAAAYVSDIRPGAN